ncbi:cytochrome c biogenesis protein ResB [Brevibacillus panacihumi]|uniref:cytochrome c biogenesis protein ResB n=1 Tax=Brevibacillus panacihumi TaxID=497735 RepID=UPI003D006CAD
MDKVKCECGHANPLGTQLCEACGKPLQAEETGNSTFFPDMRYDGKARRSQSYSFTPINIVWNFFSSVKVAIYIILSILVFSGIGTIFPQQMYIQVPVPTEADVARFYSDSFGIWGEIFYRFGFHNLYSSWWFVTLLVMLGTSLVICSLDRVIPLYKALHKPRLNQHISFLQGQKLYGESRLELGVEREGLLRQSKIFLKKKGYRILQREESVLAEKGRFSRWGPYINHIGLIIFLLGVLLRNIPGFYLDTYVWIREGETVAIPDTPYYMENVGYKTEYWSDTEMVEQLDLKGGAIPKNYQTDAVLYLNLNANLPGASPELMEVQRGSIVVNHPMQYDDISLYQAGVQEMELGALNFSLVDKLSGDKKIGTIKLDLYQPKQEHQFPDGIKVRVLDYFPNFYLDQDGKPATKTNLPKNPMFALENTTQGESTREKFAYVMGSIISEGENGRFSLEINMPDFIDISGIMVRKDKVVPLIYFGALIFMIGVSMGTFWQHRRIWIQLGSEHLYLAGHTNKNWFGMRREVRLLIEEIEVPIVLDDKTGK